MRLMKALQHWDDCDQAASARGWLYRIAKNTAYDHLRRQRRGGDHATHRHAQSDRGRSRLESQFADAEPVWAALNHLPDHYRVPLLLQLAAGNPLHTIAADAVRRAARRPPPAPQPARLSAHRAGLYLVTSGVPR